MKAPLDPTPYPQDPRSQPITDTLPDGCYVYARDRFGTIQVLPDGPHLHPKILGAAQPTMYAGDLTIQQGQIVDLTNLSGTFQFDDEDGLVEVAMELRRIGLMVAVGAVRFFPKDGSKPITLE